MTIALSRLTHNNRLLVGGNGEMQRDLMNVDALLEAYAEHGGRGLGHNGAIEVIASIGRLVLACESNDCAQLADLARKYGLLHKNDGVQDGEMDDIDTVLEEDTHAMLSR